LKEYHISECCKAELFFKGAGKGFWCSNCKKEITRTIVAFNDKEKKENSAMNKAINNIRTGLIKFK
jgi:hypothetical protein